MQVPLHISESRGNTFFSLGLHLESKHAFQTSTHLPAGFLEHHVRAEWVSVVRRPCLTRCVPGDYKVSASVFPRQVTHPLSEQLLSLRLGFPQLLLDLHDVQQGRAVRGFKFISLSE